MADSFACPRCGRTSHNPNDGAEGYCGDCHAWTGNNVCAAVWPLAEPSDADRAEGAVHSCALTVGHLGAHWCANDGDWHDPRLWPAGQPAWAADYLAGRPLVDGHPLALLYEHALPSGAPGAWTRSAIERPDGRTEPVIGNGTASSSREISEISEARDA